VEYQLAIAMSRMGASGTAASWIRTASKFGVGEGTVNRVFEIWSRSVVELRSVRRFVFLRSAAEATN